jgi:hypothetical protein
MRLGRLVAAGLVAGALAGFVGALLRPRTVQDLGNTADGSGDPPTEVPDAGPLDLDVLATSARRLDLADETPVAASASARGTTG